MSVSAGGVKILLAWAAMNRVNVWKLGKTRDDEHFIIPSLIAEIFKFALTLWLRRVVDD